MSISPITCLTLLLLAATVHAASFVEHKERHLGPTGMFGVTSPADITIVKVEPGSPADGLVKPGDTFTAAGGIAFKDHTRQQLATAIDRAEAAGTLTLTRQDGSTVDLTLPVLGAYADTAPFDCPKTEAIITRTADHLVATKDFGRADLPIALLGLLATGEPEYLDFVKKQVRAAHWASPKLKLSIATDNRRIWSWGYTALFLGEYYLLTGDEHVLPAIRTYALALARGRDAAGLWGHSPAALDFNDGQRHGRCYAYGIMNQSSLPCFLALILAQKSGVNHPDVLAAIEQTGTFYRSYIGHGTLPYGVHEPSLRSYNNNGMSALAALAFSIQGHDAGTEFFARMTAASHREIETGHTGHFFNKLWSGPGTTPLGPEATTAFFAKTQTLHTLNRKWNGDFTYDDSRGERPIYSYRNLSDAGAHLLSHCLGRRALLITGRDADPGLHLKTEAARAAVSPPEVTPELGPKRLLALLDHPLPQIRLNAATTLRSLDHERLPKVLNLLKTGTPGQRAAAFRYFGRECPPDQAAAARDTLAAILRDPADSLHARASAARALAHHGEAAHPCYNDMLRLVADEKPNDPLQRTNDHLGRTLNLISENPYADGLVTDKRLFYAAARALLEHPRDSGRAAGARLLAHIPRQDLPRVAEPVTHLLADQDRSYHSYHNLVPHAVLIAALGKHRIQEGLEAALATYQKETGKYSFRARMFTHAVPEYGAAAKALLPKLRELHPGPGRFEKPWNEMLQTIESAGGPTDLVPFSEIPGPEGKAE